jgi:hypothetical protein
VGVCSFRGKWMSCEEDTVFVHDDQGSCGEEVCGEALWGWKVSIGYCLKMWRRLCWPSSAGSEVMHQRML